MACNAVSLLIFVVFAFVSVEGAEKLVGARDAQPGQFPYMVSLRQSNRHFCGGSIISNYHILTAAHCVRAVVHVNLVTVVSGSIYLDKGGHSHRVASMQVDPRFDTDIDKDVGVIKLADPIQFDEYQTSIALTTARPPDNAYAVISGFGYISTPPSHVSNTLLYLDLKMISFNDCKRVHHNITSAVCTLDKPNVGLCSGDSGSPLVYNNQVVAVAARAVLCAKGYPDIYASVYDSLSFITKAMQM